MQHHFSHIFPHPTNRVGETTFAVTKINPGLERIKEYLTLLEAPVERLNVTQQSIVNKIRMLTAHYVPCQTTYYDRAEDLAEWVQQGHLTRGHQMVSSTGFTYRKIMGQNDYMDLHIVSIRKMPNNPNKFKVIQRTVADVNQRAQAALKDIYYYVKRVAMQFASVERLFEADAYIRQFAEVNFDAEQGDDLLDLLFPELRAHDQQQSDATYAACMREGREEEMSPEDELPAAGLRARPG